VKNSKRLGILFLFLIVASSLFATVSEKPRQGLISIFEDLHPASEPSETLSNAGDQPSETATPRQTNQFTGRRLDSFSQTYNHRNRQYNPKYGRWLSRDPIGFRGGLNLWAFCKNNPVRFVDPFGLDIRRAIQILKKRCEPKYQEWAVQLERNLGPGLVDWDVVIEVFKRIQADADPTINSLQREIIHNVQQVKHMGGPGTPGYEPPNSYLTVDPLPLIFQLVPVSELQYYRGGQRLKRFGDFIGKYVDPTTREESDSKDGVISFKAGTGIHLYPGLERSEVEENQPQQDVNQP